MTTEIGFEDPMDTDGWLRRLTRTLPAAVAEDEALGETVSSYYADDAQAGTTQTCVPDDTVQYGFLKESTAATPSGGTSIVTEYVYDQWGRTAGTWTTGDTGWSCSEFDDRGRAIEQTVTGPTGTTPITATTTYTATAGGVTVAVTDGATTVTTVSDLLGRTVSYTDARKAP